MSMTTAELLKQHPLPWVAKCNESIGYAYDRNGFFIFDGSPALVALQVACVNALGKYANPAAVGEALEAALKFVRSINNARLSSDECELSDGLRDALAALHTAPEPGEETER